MFWLINSSFRNWILAMICFHAGSCHLRLLKFQKSYKLKPACVMFRGRGGGGRGEDLVDFVKPPFQMVVSTMTNIAKIIPYFGHPWWFNPGVCNVVHKLRHLIILGTVSICIDQNVLSVIQRHHRKDLKMPYYLLYFIVLRIC